MGESRYFAAHGARPASGPGRRMYQGDREHESHARAAWPDHAPGGYPRYAPDPQYGGHAQDIFGAAPHPADGTAAATHPVQDGAGGAAHFSRGRHHRAPPADDPARPAAPPVSVGGVARGLGAVLSLALMVSGGVWAWQMVQRDVSGVPVVRALEGPSRVAPDDPGGTQAAHQGLSVTELAADGVSDLPEEIVLAPPPLDLESKEPAAARDAAQDVPGRDMLLEIGLQAPDSADATSDDPPLGLVRPNRLAVARSPRPAARGTQTALQNRAAPDADSALAASIADSVAADLSRSGGIDVDPASIGPGTRLVQLGTYDSAAEARRAWDGLANRFDPLLNERGRVIEAAHSGGSVFYRLRAHGFDGESDARRFCAALIDRRLDCIPVLVR